MELYYQCEHKTSKEKYLEKIGVIIVAGYAHDAPTLRKSTEQDKIRNHRRSFERARVQLGFDLILLLKTLLKKKRWLKMQKRRKVMLLKININLINLFENEGEG